MLDGVVQRRAVLQQSGAGWPRGLPAPASAVVGAVARDKDAHGFLAELGRRALAVVCTSVPSATRGLPADELHAIATALGIASEVEPDPQRAFRRGAQQPETAGAWLLVTGSLYLVGALRGDVYGSERRTEAGLRLRRPPIRSKASRVFFGKASLLDDMGDRAPIAARENFLPFWST